MDEVGSMMEMPVEVRLGLVFAEVAVTVHMENSAREGTRRQRAVPNYRQPDLKKEEPPKMN